MKVRDPWLPVKSFWEQLLEAEVGGGVGGGAGTGFRKLLPGLLVGDGL